MKILKYSLLLISLMGLSMFFGCGDNGSDPTPGEIIVSTWKISDTNRAINDYPSFRITFKSDLTYSITSGGAPSIPAYNSCLTNTGDFVLSADFKTVTFSAGGKTSTVNIIGNITAEGLTGRWTQSSPVLTNGSPNPDVESNCGDKTEPTYTFELVKVIQ